MSSDNKTILLVEDEAIIALDEKMILENHGYNVITSISGEEAVTAIDNNPETNLILMDINLGKGIDGTEAAQLILGKVDLPLIFLSVHTDQDTISKTEGITSYGYVDKTSGETVLIASIKMAFKLFETKLREKEKEKLLRASEQLYRNLVETTSAIAWEVDLVSLKYNYISPQVFDISGFRPDEWLDYDFWEAHVHPDDREATVKFCQQKTQEGVNHDFEYRLLKKDGSVVKIRDMVSVIKENGKPVALRGFFIDVDT